MRLEPILIITLVLASCGDNITEPPDAEIIEPPIPALLTMSPASAQLGSVTVGTMSPVIMFTVYNFGQIETGQVSAIVAGANATELKIVTECSTLAGGKSCQVGVIFNPTSAGTKSARLVVSSSPGGTVLAMLDGTGTP